LQNQQTRKKKKEKKKKKKKKKKMSTVFQVEGESGAARTGRLAFPVTGASHPTPLILHGTDKGSLPHVPNPLMLKGVSPYREAAELRGPTW
jgi:hypothetical protein